MMEAQERHIEVPKTARYWVLGEAEALAQQIGVNAPLAVRTIKKGHAFCIQRAE